jgi:uncharacterized protein YukE
VAHSIVIGSPEFQADLKAFAHAITTVTEQRDALLSYSKSLIEQFTVIEAAWQSPAGTTFPPLQRELADSFATLNEVLDAMILKMKATEANYRDAEAANTAVLGGHGGHGGGRR